ncbi:MAG: hypothetical protein K6U80_07060 [Firmicutes bacterium]|nr:hypothetical protein [Bacillota bacterium]
MYKVVGVRFKQAGKIYYFDPNGFENLKANDNVIVETVRGIEFGQVMVGIKEVPPEKVTLPLKRVLRMATPEDELQLRDNEEKEKKAFQIFLQKIEQHQLVMKLIDVEYTFDRSKIIFYFTADGRVDFRELVKDLANVFRTRIELRQIGVRDEAKMLGGLGPCGRPLCCATFLGDFEPVSIKMAKEQNLSLNPVKISGICSRLMCCLKYESSSYRDAKADLPLIGSKVRVDGREGKIISVNALKETLLVEFSDGTKKETLPADIEELFLENHNGANGRQEEHKEQTEPEESKENREQPKQNKEQREPDHHRENQNHEPKDNKDNKDNKENREQPKQNKEQREPNHHRENQNREPRDNRDNKGSREQPKEYRDQRENREPKDQNRRPRENRDQRAPQNNQNQNRGPRDQNRPPRENRDHRENNRGNRNKQGPKK